MENCVGRSNFMLKYYKNYKEELDVVNEESKKFKPKKFEDFFKEQNLDSWLKNGA